MRHETRRGRNGIDGGRYQISRLLELYRRCQDAHLDSWSSSPLGSSDMRSIMRACWQVLVSRSGSISFLFETRWTVDDDIFGLNRNPLYSLVIDDEEPFRLLLVLCKAVFERNSPLGHPLSIVYLQLVHATKGRNLSARVSASPASPSHAASSHGLQSMF